LNSIRPTTKEELAMLELGRSGAEIFITDEMELTGNKDDSSRLFSAVYQDYKVFCNTNGYKSISAKYFSTELKKLGHTTDRIKKITYIVE
jgi:ABC-type siderophore export system fused ATPase/permease subunit